MRIEIGNKVGAYDMYDDFYFIEGDKLIKRTPKKYDDNIKKMIKYRGQWYTVSVIDWECLQEDLKIAQSNK